MRCLPVLILALLLLTPVSQSEIDPYVSHPGNIPNFHNFTTPALEPGESGAFRLKITNRYELPMTLVEVTGEIYVRADIRESETIDQVTGNQRPFIRAGCWRLNVTDEPVCRDTTNFQMVRFTLGTLETNATARLDFTIHTQERTAEGTYFVRFDLDFVYNGTPREMRSRGHFTNWQWENATAGDNVADDAPGNVNLTELGIDGIIPDSSFGVKKPIPQWPLYALIFLAIFFVGLAVLFFLEEEGTYPGLNQWMQKQRGKFHQLRLRFQYRQRRP